MSEINRRAAFELSDAAKGEIERIHISMPWERFPIYDEQVSGLRTNVGIRFSGDQLDSVLRSFTLKAAAEQLQEAECRITLHSPLGDFTPGGMDPAICQILKHARRKCS